MDRLVATHSMYVHIDCKTLKCVFYHLLKYADNLNTQVCRTLKKSPYEVVYGQPPRTTPFAELPEGKGSCVMEEEVADLIDGKCILYIILVCLCAVCDYSDLLIAFVTSFFRIVGIIMYPFQSSDHTTSVHPVSKASPVSQASLPGSQASPPVNQASPSVKPSRLTRSSVSPASQASPSVKPSRLTRSSVSPAQTNDSDQNGTSSPDKSLLAKRTSSDIRLVLFYTCIHTS